MNPYKIVFYKLYQWALKLNIDSSPEWSAFVTYCILLYINFFSLLILAKANVITNLTLPQLPDYFKIIMVLVFAAPHYFFLMWNHNYIRIFTAYERVGLDPRIKNFQRIVAVTYLFLTPTLMTYSIYSIILYNKGL